ncbi:MAG TPA: glycoside hydrolase domain-containing protein [Phycisphaerae bacterium]|nr:glycoside hydrolase domain-containing protein [Phycisphaerae bacterium]
MRDRTTAHAVGLILLILAASSPLAAQKAVAPAAGRPAVVLDTAGFWRMHNMLAPPVVDDGGALRPIVSCAASGVRGGGYWKQLLSQPTAPAPADWMKVEFDDGGWLRSTAAGHCRTPYLARLCLRGKFTVTDPAKVKGLSLAVGYHGGVVVYLNGRQIARKHVAAGGAAAEPYPKDVFVTEAGKPISLRGLEYLVQGDKPSPDLTKRLEQRVRTMKAPIPAEALREGLNVLAVEIVRAPYHKVIDEQKVLLDSHGKWQVHDLSWNTCELRRVQLRAASTEGLVANATRPAGTQVWNSDPVAVDFDLDFGSQAEEVRPIRLVAARNGTYSGKVVVGSDRPIKGLVAAASDLTGPGGTIPASHVRIRYALPWGQVPLTNGANYETTPYPAEAMPLMALADAPLEEFPVRQKLTRANGLVPSDMWRYRKWGFGNRIPLGTPGQPAPVFGAVVPVWVTVKVPKTAKPGAYSGRLTIQAAGRTLADVPIELTVVDWTLPDARDFRTWVELIEMPDTTAVEYKLPLWSDRHWKMIDAALRFAGDLGSRVVYVPLIAETNLGNTESMVRWIDKGSGRYAYDFSIMDKYLDLAEARMGKPRFVVFCVWDRYLIREGNLRRKKDSLKVAKDGPIVTVVAADGNTANVMLPDYPAPESKALWQPLFDELRGRMAKRGLAKAMLLGMVSDFWASKEQAEFLKEVSGNLPWINASHYFQKSFHNGLAEFAYQATYFGTRHGYGKSLHGWKQDDLRVAFDRVQLDNYQMSKWRLLAQQCVTGNARGIGRLGADTWFALKDKRGNRVGKVWERFPAANWGYLNCNSSTLAAGPNGPVATQRYETFREGVQECEAIIVVEEALIDKARRAKLGETLAARCERALLEHNHCMWRSMISWQTGPKSSLDPTAWRGTPTPTGHAWFVGSGWQERSKRLYSLAGEVQKRLGG